MGLHHLFDNIESEAGPTFGRRVSGVEHIHTVVLGDAWTVILDVESTLVIQFSDSDCHALSGVLDCVPEQILKQL